MYGLHEKSVRFLLNRTLFCTTSATLLIVDLLQSQVIYREYPKTEKFPALHVCMVLHMGESMGVSYFRTFTVRVENVTNYT
jgi:hypothetical protein